MAGLMAECLACLWGAAKADLTAGRSGQNLDVRLVGPKAEKSAVTKGAMKAEHWAAN